MNKLKLQKFKFIAIWILVICCNKNLVECSGWTGLKERNSISSSGNTWHSLFSRVSTTIFNLKGSIDDGPNLGEVLQFERSLQNKFEEMEKTMRIKEKEKDMLGDISIPRNPIKFPEASALSPTFIRNLSGHLETWMDLDEIKKLGSEFQVLSQHIIWIRNSGARTGLSYFIYRPSFEAELDSSNILPHVKYHEEALETSQSVIETVMKYPNDQIIFAGLQSGGAIAMLHAWMVTSSVPIVFKNLKDYKGELHQIKIVLFDSDCVLSGIHAPNFPIPSWDILRFYSGKSKNISSSKCRFNSMKEIGLAYDPQFNWSNYFSQTSVQVNRATFVGYYDKSFKVIEQEGIDSCENIDHGIIKDCFDDSASEISMSINGEDARVGYSQSQSRKIQKIRKKTESSVKSIEDLIKPGIELLKFSISLSKFFYVNIKAIYKDHQQSYVQRNVKRCADAMTETLENSLLGNNEKNPVVEKVIKNVNCLINSYNEKTKNAVIKCTLESKDSVKSSVLIFQTFVQNQIDAIIAQNNVQIIENDWDEVSMLGRSISSSSESFYMMPKIGIDRSRVGSIAHAEDNNLFDDRTLFSGFNERSEQWTQCLGELFSNAKHLNFINPISAEIEDEHSIAKSSSNQEACGKSFLKINLPYSNTDTFCEYSLRTQPSNYYQLYRTSSLMFFSIFSDVIKSSDFPAVCQGILEPPNIAHKNIGNAESIAKTLNGYFNSDGTCQINPKNVVVNGLEIQESATNLPSNNPYEIFKPSLCEILAECLDPNKVIENLYDCNSHLTLWAGRQKCPEVCSYRFGNSNRKQIHLCSRVVNCGGGVFLGFRGGKTFGTEKPLTEEFESVNLNFLSENTSAAFYAAFQLKDVNGFMSNVQKPFRFAVFLSESAKSTLVDVQNSSDQSVQTFGSGSLKKRSKSENFTKLKKKENEYSEESNESQEEEEEEEEENYYNEEPVENEEFPFKIKNFSKFNCEEYPMMTLTEKLENNQSFSNEEAEENDYFEASSQAKVYDNVKSFNFVSISDKQENYETETFQEFEVKDENMKNETDESRIETTTENNNNSESIAADIIQEFSFDQNQNESMQQAFTSVAKGSDVVVNNKEKKKKKQPKK